MFLSDVTRVMRVAECWTDHKLVVSKMNLRLRPPIRANRAKPARLNVGKLANAENRQRYCMAVSSATSTLDLEGDLQTTWDTLCLNIVSVAERMLGPVDRVNEDWFYENDVILTEAITKHRALLRRERRGRHSRDTLDEIRRSSSDLRTLTRRAKDIW